VTCPRGASRLPPENTSLAADEAAAERLGDFGAERFRDDPTAFAILTPDVEIARLRHRLVRTEVSTLLPTLTAEGLRLLFFKGFALAELYYADAGARPYGDVDALVAERDVSRIIQVGQRLGWSAMDCRCGELAITSRVASLVSPTGLTHLDLQVNPIQLKYGPGSKLRRRFCEAAWSGAQACHLAGCTAWTLGPLDHLLLGLFLNRAYEENASWRPRDFFDAITIVERGRLGRDDLERRAAELGCPQTLRRCLTSCNPWTGQPDPSVNSRTARLTSRAISFSEIGHSWADLICWRARVLALLPTCLPAYVLARFRTIVHKDPRRIVGSSFPRVAFALLRLLPRERQPFLYLIARIVGAATFRLGPAKDSCVVSATALYWLCKARGIPVTFKSGVRRDTSTGVLSGHAWIEVEGTPVRLTDQPHLLKQFQVLVELT
jgi:putative nucleotidyltransferase-like protein/transglutaminase superfamily protein